MTVYKDIDVKGIALCNAIITEISLLGEAATDDLTVCGDLEAQNDVVVRKKLYLDLASSDIMIKKSSGGYASLRAILTDLGASL